MREQEAYPLFAEERREQILRMLEQRSKLLVGQLCEQFEVSPATIRNDLRDLEAEGRLKRTHGGAIPVSKAAFEPDSQHKEVERREEKQRIAACAARYIEDGDTIALDTGTTLLELAKCLSSKRGLTIVTNDLQIAQCLESTTDAGVILIGGLVRRGFHCTTGPQAMAQLKGLHVDKAFLATNAFTLEQGFTTPQLQQAEVKREMLSMASERFLLMDSGKFGRIAFTQFATAQDVDRLITDDGLDARSAALIRQSAEELDLVLV